MIKKNLEITMIRTEHFKSQGKKFFSKSQIFNLQLILGKNSIILKNIGLYIT